MQPEVFIEWYYTFIHIAPFDALLFYAFRRQLRLGPVRTALGYFLLLAAEGLVQMQVPGAYNQRISLAFQLVYLVYDLWVIRVYFCEVLAIGLLTVPLSLLSFSAARLVELHWAFLLPDAASVLVISLFVLLFLPPSLWFIHHVLEPLLTLSEIRFWRYMAGYEILVIFLALLIDPFHMDSSPRVLVSRALLLASMLVYVQLMSYLCRQIRSRAYTQQQLSQVQACRNVNGAAMRRLWSTGGLPASCGMIFVIIW